MKANLVKMVFHRGIKGIMESDAVVLEKGCDLPVVLPRMVILLNDQLRERIDDVELDLKSGWLRVELSTSYIDQDREKFESLWKEYEDEGFKLTSGPDLPKETW